MAVSDKVGWDVAPPIASAATDGRDGVARFATSGASARYKIPKGWRGRFVDFRAIGQDLEIVFGGSTVSVTYGQVSTAPSEVITPVAGTGYPIPAGQKDGWRIPDSKAISHFAIAAAGAGGWSAYPSTNRLKDGFNPEP